MFFFNRVTYWPLVYRWHIQHNGRHFEHAASSYISWLCYRTRFYLYQPGIKSSIRRIHKFSFSKIRLEGGHLYEFCHNNGINYCSWGRSEHWGFHDFSDNFVGQLNCWTFRDIDVSFNRLIRLYHGKQELQTKCIKQWGDFLKLQHCSNNGFSLLFLIWVQWFNNFLLQSGPFSAAQLKRDYPCWMHNCCFCACAASAWRSSYLLV